MIGFIYQLASTTAHLIAYAGRIVAEETGIITDRWEWAIVHLMGQKTLHGKVLRHDSHVEVLAFSPDQNDILVESFHGWQAVYSIDIKGESIVRREYVEKTGTVRWKACDNWLPSSVAPDLCKTCAFEHEYHVIAKAQAERVALYELAIQRVLKDPDAAVRMHNEDGGPYEGIGFVGFVAVKTGGVERSITVEEYSMARQAGVLFGPYVSKDPCDEIPF